MKTITKLVTVISLLGCSDSFSQTCYPVTTKDLDINNVRARIINGSDKWYDLSSGNPVYEIPKGSGKHSMYEAALWIGGYDANGNIHLSAQTYRQTGNDFWEGPVEKNGCAISTDTVNCPTYQHIWKFLTSDITNFISTGTATNDITTYPANGDWASG